VEDANFDLTIKITTPTATAGREGKGNSDCRSTGSNAPGKERDHVQPQGGKVCRGSDGNAKLRSDPPAQCLG
jgi:hypothetical protein